MVIPHCGCEELKQCVLFAIGRCHSGGNFEAMTQVTALESEVGGVCVCRVHGITGRACLLYIFESAQCLPNRKGCFSP